MFRRLMIASAAAFSLGGVAVANEHAAHADHDESAHAITVYKSPTCGCCKRWIAHLEEAGFEVEAIDSDDMNAVKQRFDVPRNMTSCHTARIAGYTIEGHVPADDILRLLSDKPDADGLSVPGMPVGSPGMEVGDRVDPYRVMLFGEDGDATWAAYDAEGRVEAADDATESG